MRARAGRGYVAGQGHPDHAGGRRDAQGQPAARRAAIDAERGWAEGLVGGAAGRKPLWPGAGGGRGRSDDRRVADAGTGGQVAVQRQEPARLVDAGRHRGLGRARGGDRLDQARRELSAELEGVRQLHAVVRIQGGQGGQLGRRRPHAAPGLAFGRRHGNADLGQTLRRAPGQASDHGHLWPCAAPGPGRSVGRVEPGGDQGRRVHDFGVGQRRVGAAIQHVPSSRVEVSPPARLGGVSGPYRRCGVPQGVPAGGAGGPGAGGLVRTAGAEHRHGRG